MPVTPEWGGEFPAPRPDSPPLPPELPYEQVELSEMRAVWVGYPDLRALGVTPQSLDKIVATAKSRKMNAIIFHVRPFGDALYPSEIFPWSHFVTGEQGKPPENGFDPLAYVIRRAHNAGIQVHAWVNPLRIQSSGGTLPEKLSDDNPYVRFRSDGDPANDDYVIDFVNGKYYNPGRESVRNLIIDGVAEIVENYPVDGIHFDDYFYPADDGSFDDSAAYNDYVNSGGSGSLIAWRTANINSLVSGCYDRVKSIRPVCVFGISPAGNIKNCLNMGADVRLWSSGEGYVDYICPQIYWSFDHDRMPFETVLREWREMVSDDIKFYVGLALYKSGSDADKGKWLAADDIISSQIQRARQPDVAADGFMLFSYSYLTGEQTANEMKNIMSIIDEEREQKK